MSPCALRHRLRRLRGSLVASGCVLALALAVVAHHTPMLDAHGAMDGHGAVAMVMCLGVLGLAAMAVASLPAVSRLPSRRPGAIAFALADLRLGSSGAHPTRAGPPLFLVFAVLRR